MGSPTFKSLILRNLSFILRNFFAKSIDNGILTCYNVPRTNRPLFGFDLSQRIYNMNELKTKHLFDLSHTLAAELFLTCEYPWETLSKISEYIIALGKTWPADRSDQPSENVWIAKSTTVSPSASIGAPCIIDEGAEIRQSAFIRGAALVGAGAVVGNSCELKNCILFDGAQVPHFNYVGDSILGYKAHMGAGSITSNVKSDKTNVTLRIGNKRLETGMRKFGAILGDYVEIGCNCVLNPGTVIGRNSSVYPLTGVRGFVPAEHIVKSGSEMVRKAPR